MAFLSKCAIQDSSPQIWRQLVKIGLKRNPFSPRLKESTWDNPLCTVVDNGIFYDLRKRDLTKDVTDCGKDDRLFFALAALRDDSDIHQVFIYDNRSWNEENPQRFWFRCDLDKIEDDMCKDSCFLDCAKATKEELLYHFSGQDDDDCYGDEVTPYLCTR